ncbi:LPS translocon maturation chaperone LptM [Dongshaea marina]|uniref:LPS translocon maturation chaperone LptM n=1 Tax=Dongshaea marina TaxID=2047966 RepID=UPI000D3E2DCA
MRIKLMVTALFAVFALAGCGLKGPLYMPPPAKKSEATQPQTQTQAPPQQDTPQQKE